MLSTPRRLLLRRLLAIILAMRRPGFAIAALAALLLGAWMFAGPFARPACTAVTGVANVSIAIANLPRNTAKFFCYRTSAGQRLRFILARDDDGKVHAVFDACSQCYRFHKGYAVSHGYLICRLCGNRYKLDHLDRGIASCVPVRLNTADRGAQVEIKIADLVKGRTLF
jgi:uncharacterized membrane protein